MKRRMTVFAARLRKREDKTRKRGLKMEKEIRRNLLNEEMARQMKEREEKTGVNLQFELQNANQSANVSEKTNANASKKTSTNQNANEKKTDRLELASGDNSGASSLSSDGGDDEFVGDGGNDDFGRGGGYGAYGNEGGDYEAYANGK
jgi:hypothetical protein